MVKDNIGYKEPDFDVINAKLLKKSSIKCKNNKLKNYYDTLFKNFLFSGLNLKNHLCFINLNDDIFYDFGIPNNKFFNFYEKIAATNVGLIVTGGVFCDNKNKSHKTASAIIINNYDVINKHRELVQKVHSSGSKIFLQLKSAYGRGDCEHLFANVLPYGATYSKAYKNANLITYRISDSKCNEIVDKFKRLTKFSIDANYDGIMINGDVFNIIGELSSKEFNKRVFGYYSNIYDISTKILSNIKLISKNIPIIYSLTIDTFLEKIYKNNAKNIISIRKNATKSSFLEILNYMKTLVTFGVDGFIIKFGTYETEFMSVYNQMQSNDLFCEYYTLINDYFDKENIKNKFDEKVSIIYADNFSDLEKPTEYLCNGLINFIDVTRQIYADQLYIKNLINDKLSKPCIKCGFCNHAARIGKIKCAINPHLTHKTHIEKKQKKVAVVGAGIAGINCVNFLANDNISIDLFEMGNILNKNGKICEIFNYDEYLKLYNDYIENILYKNISSNKVNLFVNTKFESKLAINYDAVILATGFKEQFLNLNGSILKNVKSIYEALSTKTIFNDSNKIVIYAKSELSIKLAIYLSTLGKTVSLIFPCFDEIKKIYNDKYTYYFYILSKFKITAYIDGKIKKINHDFVDVIVNNYYLKEPLIVLSRNLYSNIKYKSQPRLISVDMDLFIYEPELKPNNKLFYDIVSSGYSGQVFMIGNALQISDLSEIIDSAYFVAKNL